MIMKKYRVYSTRVCMLPGTNNLEASVTSGFTIGTEHGTLYT
jgi:hypothetical protein